MSGDSPDIETRTRSRCLRVAMWRPPLCSRTCEPHQEEGRLRNVVIVAFRGQVLRSTPQQLRLVSEAERTLFEIDEATSKLLHHRTSEALTRLNKVYDITGEGEPDLDDLGEPPVGSDPIAGTPLPPAERPVEEQKDEPAPDAGPPKEPEAQRRRHR